MEDHFHKHKGALTNLVTILREDDDIQFLTDSSISPEGIVEEKRWDQYRNLMARIGLTSISSNWGRSPEITFRLKSFTPYARFVKGYVYSTRQPETIKENLDGSHDDLAPYARFYKKIQGDWYMYIENQSD